MKIHHALAAIRLLQGVYFSYVLLVSAVLAYYVAQLPGYPVLTQLDPERTLMLIVSGVLGVISTAFLGKLNAVATLLFLIAITLALWPTISNTPTSVVLLHGYFNHASIGILVAHLILVVASAVPRAHA